MSKIILKSKWFSILMKGLVMILISSCNNNVSFVSQNRTEYSPQYHHGKFHNKIENLYNASAAWRTVINEFLFGNKEDHIPKFTIPIKRFTGDEFYKNSEETLRFSRLGHSTILLQIGRKVWLFDPIFSKRVSMIQWIGPKRFHPPPIKIENLPFIEGVLISHNHYDHLDYYSIIKLKDRVTHFYVPLGLGKTLISWGVEKRNITELDWWESIKIEEIELVSTPAQHFSGRGIFDTDETLWTSWVLRTPKYSVYFSGDTGYFEGFTEIGEKYGPFDLTFLECGAYNESWRSMHMMPEDNIKAYKNLKGKILVPIHNGTFNMAYHPWYEPMEQIISLTNKEKIQTVIPLMGQIVDIENIPKIYKWWKQPKNVK
ncbi:MAG: MBL fold metallo-hydrolase [Spirochaetota bacterium]|nr:MBL fold metallo-hydrolase [Spirochaetota bacterium]